MPRLSIGLPVYNAAAYLRECVASILSQDLADLELIISDNASTDGSDAIALELARADSRVRVVRQTSNIGAAGNFNAVFALASAPYFKWACADDATMPGFLLRAVAELDAHPEAVMCYGATTLIDAAGKSLGESTQDLNLRAPDVVSRFRRARDHRGLLHVLQGVWRRSALEGTALFGAFPGSDEALVVEVSLRGTFHEIASPMLRRRMHAAAASADKTVAGRQEHLDPAHARSHRSLFLASRPRAPPRRLAGPVAGRPAGASFMGDPALDAQLAR